jgi:hypothetical protein
MNSILKLQELDSSLESADTGNVCGSTISTICPTTAYGEAGDSFEME